MGNELRNVSRAEFRADPDRFYRECKGDGGFNIVDDGRLCGTVWWGKPSDSEEPCFACGHVQDGKLSEDDDVYVCGGPGKGLLLHIMTADDYAAILGLAALLEVGGELSRCGRGEEAMTTDAELREAHPDVGRGAADEWLGDRAAVMALVEKLPRCFNCESPATQTDGLDSYRIERCDEHAETRPGMRDVEYAPALRLLFALVAEWEKT